MAPPPRAPPHLMPELIVDEILMRFPPDDPAFLVRASVVCKTWRSLLCDAAFRRRYAAFHRAPPPLLGFLHNCVINDHGKFYFAPRFVCTTTPSPVLPMQPFDDYNYGWRVLDCRHGRVLLKPSRFRRARVLFNTPEVKVSSNLAVWDRATGEHELVPKSPSPRRRQYTAAVLCAVRGCDHLDCDGGPFLVLSVGCKPLASDVRSRVYSSEVGTWTSSSFLGPAAGYVTSRKPSVFIGDDIYFVLATQPVIAMAILKIDLGRNHLSIINPPETHNFNDGNAILMATEDGSLGIAAILGSTLRLWSRNVMNSEKLGGWAPCRVIELQTMIPFKERLRIVGSAEGAGIIFVASDDGVFSLDLKSGREKKVDEPREGIIIFPFMGFYTPDGSSRKLRLPMGPPHESMLLAMCILTS